MAIELKYLAPIAVFLCIHFLQTYCVEVSQTSTTPWPELGSRRRPQTQSNLPVRSPTTPASKRDFVSQPSAWNKPLIPPSTPKPQSNMQQQQQQPSIRDFVSSPRPLTAANSNSVRNTTPNPNIKLSYASAINPNSGTAQKGNSQTRLTPSVPVRDYVNPNVQLSYSNAIQGTNMNSKPATSVSKPLSQSPTTSTSTASVSPSAGYNNNNNGNANQDTTNSKVSVDDELREFSESLIRKDTNNAFKYVKVNYQGMTRSSSMNDEAPEPLMAIESGAYKIPTVEKLMLLYNNYIIQSNQNEVYTAQEKIEENNFLDSILPTAVMQHTRNFLISKGKISKDPKDFKDVLRTIWFNMYSRGGGKIGSSGFEHVFLSEIKNDAVSGLHNWVYFNEEEKKNLANYLGYMKKIEFEKGAIVKYHFNFHQKDKPVGSMFIGTSPEFEFALYSTCFLVRPDEVCPLRLGGKNFIIRTYTYRYRGKNMIGSAFPEI